MGQLRQAGDIELNHLRVFCQITLKKASMTANACVIHQNINCNAQTFGFGKNFRCGIRLRQVLRNDGDFNAVLIM